MPKFTKVKKQILYTPKEEEFGQYAINVKDMELLKEGCIENISLFKLVEVGGNKYYVSKNGFRYDEDSVLESKDWILLWCEVFINEFFRHCRRNWKLCFRNNIVDIILLHNGNTDVVLMELVNATNIWFATDKLDRSVWYVDFV